MPRQMMEGMIPKIRKRGCSSSSSASSRVHHYRFKRAILVGKARTSHGLGLGGSRTSTPVPTWKMTPSRTAVGSPRSRAVSARRLAATLWEMNEMPTPNVVEKLEESKRQKQKKKMLLKRESMMLANSGSGSGPWPSYLSDPSHSPVSERMGRSGTSSRQTRKPVISQKLKPIDQGFEVLDSLSSASLMEIESRSRTQTPSGTVTGLKNRLKDVSSALTTSKELLKIVNRIWANADQPSSCMSLVSALHAELERARLLVNQLIKEKRADQSEINYLMKCFADEKAACKSKEKQAIDAAIESIAVELEVERKLRRRSESLNKKLEQELAEANASYMKVVKELEEEKRAREITEQVCDELARDIGEDKNKMDNLNRESAKIHEKLREERVQRKAPEAKHHFEEKHSAIAKLRKQLEVFIGRKRSKGKGHRSQNFAYDESVSASPRTSHFGSQHDKVKEDDGGYVDDVVEECSVESDLHSIELNSGRNFKNYKWAHTSTVRHDTRRASVSDAMKGRNSFSGQVPKKSTPLQRSVSDVVEWDVQSSRDGMCQDRLSTLEKQAQIKAYRDETERYHQSPNGRRDHVLLSSSKAGSVKDFPSPTRLLEHPWYSRDAVSVVSERSSNIQGSRLTSRLAEIGEEGRSMGRSNR